MSCTTNTQAYFLAICWLEMGVWPNPPTC